MYFSLLKGFASQPLDEYISTEILGTSAREQLTDTARKRFSHKEIENVLKTKLASTFYLRILCHESVTTFMSVRRCGESGIDIAIF